MSKDETLTSPANPNSEERNICTITHLAGILFSFIPALIVWTLKKDDSIYIATQAREALNFQITVLIGHLVAVILIWVLIGFLLMPVIWLLNIVLCILAAISSSKGKVYRYPFSLRLIN